MKTTLADFEFFISQLPMLLKEHSSEFVLIKDKQIIGFYPNIETALTAGYTNFGNQDFLIQEITDEKRINFVNMRLNNANL